MGTSKNRNRVNPSIPLIPDWIDDAPIPDHQQEPEEEQNDQQDEQDNQQDVQNDNEGQPQLNNRFYQIQREFKRGVKREEISRPLFTRVLKNYVRQGGGGSRTLAKRMRRSASSVVRFSGVINNIRANGIQNTLTGLNLQQFIGGSVIDILSALIDTVCGDGAILDDAITKMAYANAITRIDEENPNLDLDNLTQFQVGEMAAIFIEETIVFRLITDIGRSLTVATSDFEKAREIEEEIYQIVNGMVNGIIVPLLNTAVTNNNLQNRIDTIYQTAFETIING